MQVLRRKHCDMLQKTRGLGIASLATLISAIILAAPALLSVRAVTLLVLDILGALCGDGGLRALVLAVAAGISSVAAWRIFDRTSALAFILTSFFSVGAVVVGGLFQADAPTLTVPRGYFAIVLIWQLLPFLVGYSSRGGTNRSTLVQCFVTVGTLHAFFFLFWLVRNRLPELDFVLKGSRPIVDLTGSYGNLDRYPGVTSSPTATGALLVLTWPAFLGLLSTMEQKTFPRVFLWTTLAYVIAALLGTFSRAAILGLGVQTAFLLALVSAKRGFPAKRDIKTALFVVIGVAVVFELTTAVLARRISAGGASVENRLTVLRAALELLKERSGSGFGFGSFEYFFRCYYSLPGVGYYYPDVHSWIFERLFALGFGGSLLAFGAVFGFSPQAVCKRVPVWLAVSLVGSTVSLVSENPTSRALGAELCLVFLAALVIVYRAAGNRHPFKPKAMPAITFRSRPRDYAVIGILAIWWVISFLTPPRTPAERLATILTSVSQQAVGETHATLYHRTYGYVWEQNADVPYASVVGALSLLGRVCLHACTKSVDLPDFKSSPSAGHVTSAVLPAPDAFGLAIHHRDREVATRLAQSLGHEHLDKMSVAYFGTAALRGDSPPFPCSSCSFFEPPRERRLRDLSLRSFTTTATIRQLAHLFADVVESTAPCATVVNSSLDEGADEWGMFRHLGSVRGTKALSFYVGDIREEVLYLPVSYDSVVFGMHYRADHYIMPRVDTVANRMFAMAGWRLWCVLRSHGPEILGELKQRQEDPSYRPRSQQFGWWLWEGLKRAWRENEKNI